MNQDEIETLLAQLATQYAEACQEELAAIADEMRAQQEFSVCETYALSLAYETGRIAGKNAEQRKAQSNAALLGDSTYRGRAEQLEAAVLARKRATAVRVGVEHEWKTWRAWLNSQGGER